MNVNIQRYGIGSLFIVSSVWLAGCGAANSIKPSQATCTQFLTKQQTNQPSAAYNLLSTPCKRVTSMQAMKGFWTTLDKKRGKVISWSQTGFQVFSGTNGSSVTLGYAINYAKGKAAVQFSCVEENNKWLIQSFRYEP